MYMKNESHNVSPEIYQNAKYLLASLGDKGIIKRYWEPDVEAYEWPEQ